jgi:hypothetical protein
VLVHNNFQPKETVAMKLSRNQVRRKAHKVPELRFEDQSLTSFSGLVVFQLLFARLNLYEKLTRCFRHLLGSESYGLPKIVLLLLVHLLLGFRHLREMRFYRDDPMVLRLIGLSTLPDVSTLSRALADADEKAVDRFRYLCRNVVLQRLSGLGLRRVTLDFDGSVLGTGRCAEGTAVGFNRKKKGQRSYYPLFCTVAQTGQVFDVLHRPGNVHDSRGAQQFVLQCVQSLRQALPGLIIEVRMDGAFFSDAMVNLLEQEGIEFTLSVPFARFADLKGRIERRRLWYPMDADRSYFELKWKPRSWSRRFRFLVVRTRVRRRSKEPVQLDLFVPYAEGYEFKVVVTNKALGARKVVAFHDGRGAQEAVFGEMKTHGQLDYVPFKTLRANQIFLWACVLAHNLSRELQMQVSPPQRSTTAKRPPLWCFQQLGTLRRNLLQRAGRLIHPQGRLTLSLGANRAIREELLHYVEQLQPAV